MGKSEIDFKMTRMRTGLIQRHPFWGTLALYLEIIETEEQPTMATDGRRLLYNKSWINKLTEKELEGVGAHEVTHCAYRHMTRRGERDHGLWNAACDYVVNRDLLEAKFELPKPHLFDKRFDDMSAEQVYEILLKEQDNKGCPNYTSCGIVLDAGSEDEADGKPSAAEVADLAAEWDIRLRQAVATERARNAGNLPASIQRLFNMANKPTVDWRQRLRQFVDAGARFDYTWARPNRALFSIGIITPGMIADGINQLVIILDTSGSVYGRPEMMTAFLNELQGLMDESATKRLVFICADTEIKDPQIFEFGDKLNVKVVGGGGTSFAPAIEWVRENEPDTSALLYFTDLEVWGDGWGKDPGIPVLWVTYGSEEEVEPKIAKIPYGEAIHITIGE